MSVTTTTHYGLKKPDGSEAIKPDAFNDNAEVIDEQLYKSSVLTGTTAPTTSTAGAVGQFYLDTAAKILYQCMTQGSVYTWQPVSTEWKLLQAYTTAGSYVFTVPKGISELGVFIVGGGGSGGAALTVQSSYYLECCGGSSGFSKALVLDAVAEGQFNLVVGAGGAAVGGSVGSDFNTPGNNGGSSTFNGVTANGGGGGISYSGGVSDIYIGKEGGQRACPVFRYMWGSEFPWDTAKDFYGGHLSPSYYYSNTMKYDGYNPLQCYNPFTNELCLGGGGPAANNGGGQVSALVGGKNPVTGLGGGDGLSVAWTSGGGNAIAQSASEFGSGGGAVSVYRSSTYSGVVKSGAGADGAVFIYGR